VGVEWTETFSFWSRSTSLFCLSPPEGKYAGNYTFVVNFVMMIRCEGMLLFSYISE
jgi:hypothetical protein